MSVTTWIILTVLVAVFILWLMFRSDRKRKGRSDYDYSGVAYDTSDAGSGLFDWISSCDWGDSGGDCGGDSGGGDCGGD